MADRNKVEVTLTLRERQLIQAYRRVSNAIKGRNEAINDSFDKLKNTSGKTFDRMQTGANTARVAFTALSAFITGRFVSAMVAAEKSTVKVFNALEVGTGSAEKAREEFEFIEEEADRLGLSLQKVSEDYAKLTAATKGTSIEGAQTREIFLATAEAAGALGLSADETRGALNAFQQMVSKGNVQAEELRGQLGERIPGAFIMAARAMDISTQELNKMLEQGQVLAEDLLPKLAKEMRETYGEQALVGAEKMTGQINRLETSFFNFRKELLNSGGRDAIIKFLEAASEAMAWATENVDLLIAAGKTFFVVFAISKIQAVTTAITAMSLKLSAMNPIIAGMTAALLGLEGALAILERRADSIGGTDFLQNIGDVRKVRDAALNIQRLRGEVEQIRDAMRETTSGRTLTILAEQDVQKSEQIRREMEKIQGLAGEGFIREESNVGAIIAGLDAQIQKLEQVKKVKEEVTETEQKQVDDTKKRLEDARAFELMQLQGAEEMRREMDARELERLQEKFRLEQEAFEENLKKVQAAAEAELAIERKKSDARLALARTSVSLFNEISDNGRQAFLLTKAIAAAEIFVNWQRTIALNNAQLGFLPAQPINALTSAQALTSLGLVAAQTIKGFQGGGRPAVGEPALVGERGPEIFVPDRAGTVIPNNAIGGVTFGDTQIIIQGNATPETAELIGETIQEKQRQFADQLVEAHNLGVL